MCIVQLGLRRSYTFGAAAKADLAVTQTTAQAQSNLRAFPPGAQPPSIPEYAPSIPTSMGRRRAEADDQCDYARRLVLAVGILVNDAAVTFESKHRNINLRKPLVRAVLDGASDRPTSFRFHGLDLHPAGAGLVADGRGEIPVGARQAVALAMLASWSLWHRLIPTMAQGLLKPEVKLNAHGVDGGSADGRSLLCDVHHWFNRPLALALIRSSDVVWFDRAIDRPAPVLPGFAVFDKRLPATGGLRQMNCSPPSIPARSASMPGPRADPDRADGTDLWRAPTVSCIMFANNDQRPEGLGARWSALAAGMACRAVIGGRALATPMTLVIARRVQPAAPSAAG
jgi:hypothetical protein